MAIQWARWEKDIAALRSFTVPRYYYPGVADSWNKELIVFCDASEDACAAVAYARAVSRDAVAVCHLVMAKTRLMPLKTLSIPRGELMACQLATRLAKTACDQLGLNKSAVTYLSDSTTALWWIRGEARNFRSFVANRVAEITSESDPSQWHHVRTELNVADIAIRGFPSSDINPQSRWIRGPDFIWTEQSEWPLDDVQSSNCPPAEAELKKKVLQVGVPADSPLDPAAYSGWTRLLRVTAWLLCYRHNLLHCPDRASGPLAVDELKKAELFWIRRAQQDRFQTARFKLCLRDDLSREAAALPVSTHSSWMESSVLEVESGKPRSRGQPGTPSS